MVLKIKPHFKNECRENKDAIDSVVEGVCQGVCVAALNFISLTVRGLMLCHLFVVEKILNQLECSILIFQNVTLNAKRIREKPAA